MTSELILIALLWGSVGGFLALHALANLLAVGFCLHGLLRTRWRRLVQKAAAGGVKYVVNLKLLGRTGCYTLLFFLLLQWMDGLVRHKYGFTYADVQVVIAGLAACAVLAVGCKSAYRRLEDIWKMSHQFDYAERRQRTRLLKS